MANDSLRDWVDRALTKIREQRVPTMIASMHYQSVQLHNDEWDAITAALAEQVRTEPVAWRWRALLGDWHYFEKEPIGSTRGNDFQKEALYAAQPQSAAMSAQQIAEITETIVLDVSEIPDRNSPESQPEMMLVTSQELRNIVTAALKEAGAAAIRALLPDPQSSGWISVKERLPDNRIIVLVAGGAGYLRDGAWWTICECPHRPIQWEVTHWQPLPDPPTKAKG